VRLGPMEGVITWPVATSRLAITKCGCRGENVLVLLAFDLTGTHRERGVKAFERLGMALFSSVETR
jgi:hypothetical protein